MANSEPSDPSLNPSGKTEAGDFKTPSWEVAGSDPGFSIKLKTSIKIIRGHLLHNCQMKLVRIKNNNLE